MVLTISAENYSARPKEILIFGKKAKHQNLFVSLSREIFSTHFFFFTTYGLFCCVKKKNLDIRQQDIRKMLSFGRSLPKGNSLKTKNIIHPFFFVLNFFLTQPHISSLLDLYRLHSEIFFFSYLNTEEEREGGLRGCSPHPPISEETFFVAKQITQH